MKNHIKTTFVVSAIFLLINISGCIEENNNNQIQELEIVNYNIVTEAYSYDTNWEYFGDGFYPDNLPEIAPNSTVYLPYEYSKARYRINVTLKNIADYTLSKVTVNFIFYDKNNNTLTYEQLKNFTDLKPGLTRFFEYEYDYYYKYFQEVDHLEITTGPLPLDINLKESL
jgi:hypothetical protein